MEHVPTGTPSPVPAGRHAQPAQSNSTQKKQLTQKIALIAAGVAALLLMALGAWFLYQSSPAATIDNNKYQAVFFTNGQVYFGKLQRLSGGYFKLTDIFYLQAQTPATAGSNTTSKNPQQTTDQQSQDVQLIKLGNEVHGPEDEMIVSKEQILFFENLKKDGKVTDSINKYNSQKK